MLNGLLACSGLLVAVLLGYAIGRNDGYHARCDEECAERARLRS